MATDVQPAKGMGFTIYGERQVFTFVVTSVRKGLVYYVSHARWSRGSTRDRSSLTVSEWQRLAEDTWMEAPR